MNRGESLPALASGQVAARGPEHGSLPPSTDVLVVGAGIAGCTLAYELSRRGVECALVDRTAPGAGASGVPAALINPHRGRSARASDADLGGAAAFWELTESLEREVGFSGAQRSGVLRIPDQERQARAWRRLAEQSDGLRWLEPGGVPEPYHAPFGALLVEGGGWAATSTLLRALTLGAAARGARVSEGAEFVSVERGSDGLLVARFEAREADGRSHGGEGKHASRHHVRCRALVVATGAWQPAGLRLPAFELVWGAAQVLELGVTPPYPLAGSVVAAFSQGRAVVTGGHRTVGSVTEAVSDDAPEGLRRSLAWQLPSAAEAPEVGRWQGVRAKRPSAEPVARRLCPGVYLLNGFGGRGFLRAASVAGRLAERLAARLAQGQAQV